MPLSLDSSQFAPPHPFLSTAFLSKRFYARLHCVLKGAEGTISHIALILPIPFSSKEPLSRRENNLMCSNWGTFFSAKGKKNKLASFSQWHVDELPWMNCGRNEWNILKWKNKSRSRTNSPKKQGGREQFPAVQRLSHLLFWEDPSAKASLKDTRSERSKRNLIL